MDKESLSPELKLVLLCAVDAEPGKEDQIKVLVNSTLDWSMVLFQAATHRTINILNHNLRKLNLTSSLEKELQRLLDSQWLVYTERNQSYLEETCKVLNAFAEKNLVVPVIKGNLLANLVYPCPETRIFNDLDLLMQLNDIEQVTAALLGLGYIQGHYDEKSKTIVEATRKEKLLQQVASHELQEFQKLGQNRFAPLLQVDVNHDVLWKGNCPYKIKTEDIISRAIPCTLAGVAGYMLDYPDNIIQLCCHLYKEAVMMMWITDLRDLKIYKFADIYMYIRKYMKEIDWNDFIERVRQYKIEKIIYYNFHYIGMMFDKIIPEEVLDKIKPADLGFLDEYGIENQEPSRWQFDFFTRLFDTNRVVSLQEKEMKNMQRFIDAKEQYDGQMIHRKSTL